MGQPLYAPFYCEENIWQLCAARGDASGGAVVVLVANPGRSCVLFGQRAAPVGRPVAWDYHVFLLCDDGRGGEQVWDLDTRLGAPVARAAYFAATFAPPGALPARFEPRFLLVEATAYLRAFSSDRAHMRSRAGAWRKPPPPWPPIERPGAPSFLTWLDEAQPSPGRWLGLADVLAAPVVALATP